MLVGALLVSNIDDENCMNRWLPMTLIAIAVICLGCLSAIYINSRPLASATVDFGNVAVALEITVQNGNIYVTARERKSGSYGRMTMDLVGSAQEIGVENASIDRGVDGNQVQLRVGKKALVFAFDKWSFSPR